MLPPPNSNNNINNQIRFLRIGLIAVSIIAVLAIIFSFITKSVDSASIVGTCLPIEKGGTGCNMEELRVALGIENTLSDSEDRFPTSSAVKTTTDELGSSLGKLAGNSNSLFTATGAVNKKFMQNGDVQINTTIAPNSGKDVVITYPTPFASKAFCVVTMGHYHILDIGLYNGTSDDSATTCGVHIHNWSATLTVPANTTLTWFAYDPNYVWQW